MAKRAIGRRARPSMVPGHVKLALTLMLESGERKTPSLAMLKRLAKALGVPVTELLE